MTQVSQRPTLREIYENHRGRQAMKWDHYLDIYQRYLEPYRGTGAHILEIGVFKGGSLQIWREYFGDDARLTAIDNDPETQKVVDEDMMLFIGGQGDPEFLATVRDTVPSFDIVIDDGSHVSSDQIASFECLFPHLNERGLYIVEDVHAGYWPTHTSPGSPTFIDFASDLVNSQHSWYQHEVGIRSFAEPPSRRAKARPSTEFARQVEALHFHDSILIIEKCPHPAPWVRMFGAP
ncbi:MAG: class I SAM-dependent methyltransferase [Alphaproteobacteria bacterium]|nr:class I SAM-dependent methyltransferase [Alphaproteobacteria bacterium]